MSFLFLAQAYFHDLLHPLPAQLHRNSNVQIIDSIFALKVSTTGKNLLLVSQNGGHHLSHRRGGSVVGTSRLEQPYDLRSPVPGTLDEGFHTIFCHQLGYGNAGHGGISSQWNHGVAVPAQNKGMGVLHGHVELPGDEPPETGRIQNSGHSKKTFPGKATHGFSHLAHGVQRITHHDYDGIGAVTSDVFRDLLHDTGVLQEKIIATHPGFTGQTGRDDHHIRTLAGFIVVGSCQLKIVASYGSCFSQVQRLSLGNPFQDIHQHHISQLLLHQAHGGGRAHGPAAHNGNFRSHLNSLHRSCFQ